MEQRWLKKMADGRIFPFTEMRAKKNGFIECDGSGRVLPGARAPAEPEDLGQMPDPAALMEAERAGVALRVAQEALAAANVELRDLRAENATLRARVEALEPTQAQEAVSSPIDATAADFVLDSALDALPADIQTAKQVLEDIASTRYGVNLDRRASLPKLIEQVREAEQALQAAA